MRQKEIENWQYNFQYACNHIHSVKQFEGCAIVQK